MGAETEDNDEMRPEFETEVKTTRLNPINQRREPYVTGKQKVKSACRVCVFRILHRKRSFPCGILITSLIIIVLGIDNMFPSFQIEMFDQESRISPDRVRIEEGVL